MAKSEGARRLPSSSLKEVLLGAVSVRRPRCPRARDVKAHRDLRR